MNILLLMAHSIAEYDDVRMFSDLGYDVFSIGAYIDPAHPGDDKRPALKRAPRHPELAALCADQMKAKEHLPDEVLDWADVIIAHHYLDRWVLPQWPRLRGKRVIWRTCGQSDDRLEQLMGPLRRDGLQIVRYSPAEERYFSATGTYAGHDAVIRFGKYPDDYGPWDGWHRSVGNVTQDMAKRGDWCGLTFWQEATAGLTVRPAGPGSELIGGIGALPYQELLAYLGGQRCYLYTGTLPASYTLGLMEALLSGTPTICIGKEPWMGPAELFEADELAGNGADTPEGAHVALKELLRDGALAAALGSRQRKRAIDLFSVETVGPQWLELLGAP